jgi:hypothetical protein
LCGSCVAFEEGFSTARLSPVAIFIGPETSIWRRLFFGAASSRIHEIVTEWPKLHSLDGDRSARLQAMTVQTIPEYLEEERQKTAETELRTEEEAARIQLLQHGHHRKAKQPRLELLPQVKTATKKKKRETVAVARKKPSATRKMATKTRQRA